MRAARSGRVAPGRRVGDRGAASESAGGFGQRVEAGERVGEVGRPGPGCLEAQVGAAGVEGQARGDVQQAVAQALGLGAREVAGQQEGLRPGEQVVGDEHQLQPDAVEIKVAERWKV